MTILDCSKQLKIVIIFSSCHVFSVFGCRQCGLPWLWYRFWECFIYTLPTQKFTWSWSWSWSWRGSSCQEEEKNYREDSYVWRGQGTRAERETMIKRGRDVAKIWGESWEEVAEWGREEKTTGGQPTEMGGLSPTPYNCLDSLHLLTLGILDYWSPTCGSRVEVAIDLLKDS